MINCKEMKDKMIEYYYSEISEAEKKEFASHLESCSSCLNEYKKIEKTLNVVSSAGRPKLDESFGNKLYYLVKEKAGRKITSSLMFWRIPVVAAICLLAVLAIVSYNETKLNDIDAIYMLSTSIGSEDLLANDIDIEILSDEIFNDENLLYLDG